MRENETCLLLEELAPGELGRDPECCVGVRTREYRRIGVK